MNYKGLSFIIYHLSFSVALLSACSDDNQLLQEAQEQHTFRLTTSITPFEGADGSVAATRTNFEGDAFETDDRIKLKIVCPYSTNAEYGTTTYGETADGLWILKWDGSNWINIQDKDSVDREGSYQYQAGYNPFGHYEAQQTPYVYTASTWNENMLFISNNRLYSQYSHIFQANQQALKNYKKSDMLWAQTFMQTGTWNVHLSFNHVMASLKFDITAMGLSESAVATLEGMPDIDQAEVVVGDYYAERAQNITHGDYSYREKCKCSAENNGKVLGIAVIDDSQAKAIVYPMTGNPNPNSRSTISNTGIYTAYRSGNYFYLIVPPCTLVSNATLWIRDGATRYSYTLERLEFEQGKQYQFTIKKS